MNSIRITDIQTGDCLLWHGFSFLAKEVQKFQEKVYPKESAQWNHAGIFYWQEYTKYNKQLMVSEARFGGVLPANFEAYRTDKVRHPDAKALCLKPRFQIVSEEIIHLANEHYGITQYDIVNLVGFQLIRMISKNHIWLGGKKVDEKFICGEWACHNYNRFTDFWDNEKRIAPADFYLMDCFTKYEILL